MADQRKIGIRFLSTSTMLWPHFSERLERFGSSARICWSTDPDWDVLVLDNKRTMEIQQECSALDEVFTNYGGTTRHRTLLLDGSNEAFNLSSLVQERVAELTAAPGAAFKRVILITQNRALFPEGHLVACRSASLGYAYFHGFLGHLYNEIQTVSRTDPGLVHALWEYRMAGLRSGRRRFTCLMKKPSPHRIVIFGHLIRSGALKHGNVSFLGWSSATSRSLEQQFDEASRIYQSFSEEIGTVATFFRSSNRFKNFDEAEEDHWGLSLTSGAHKDSLISLVAESEMEDGDLASFRSRQFGKRRFTEKSIKASLALTSFVVAGNYSTHPLLSEIGIAENGMRSDYDRIEGPSNRLRAVLDAFDDALSGAAPLDEEFVRRGQNLHTRFMNATKAHFDQCIDALIATLCDAIV